MTNKVPALPMPEMEDSVFDFYAQRCAPGTLAYCECDAGPRHLVGIIPATDVRMHFHVDLEAHVVTILQIASRPVA